MVYDPGDPNSVLEFNTYREVLAGINLEIRAFEVHHARDFAKAFIAIKAYCPQALIYPTLVLPAESSYEGCPVIFCMFVATSLIGKSAQPRITVVRQVAPRSV